MTGPMVQVLFRVPADMRDAIKALAEQELCADSVIIRRAVQQYLATIGVDIPECGPQKAGRKPNLTGRKPNLTTKSLLVWDEASASFKVLDGTPLTIFP